MNHHEGLAVRVIPCLDVDDGRVVKGVNFENLRDAGDPVELAAAYDAEGAGELTFLDVTASSSGRTTMLDVVRAAAQERDRVEALLETGEQVRTLSEPADWSWMPDEHVMRAQLREALARGGGRTAGDLPRAGGAARHRRTDDRGSEQPFEGEGSDAQVASAPRAVDVAREAARRSQRPRTPSPDARAYPNE